MTQPFISRKPWFLALAAAIAFSGACSDAPGGASASAQSAQATASRVSDYRGVYAPSRAEKGPKEDVLSRPEVDGIFLTFEWKKVEPRKGQYDWSALDQEARRIIASGKVMAVGIRSGEAAPEWLYEEEGVARFRAIMSPHGGKGGRCWAISVPRPWDKAYLAAHDRLMQAFARHLKEIGAYDDVRIVKLNGINMHTGETRMPSGRGKDKRSADDRAADLRPDLTGETGKNDGHRKFRKRQPCLMTDSVSQWQEYGYTPTKVVTAWRALAQSTERAFPDKLLSTALLNKGGFPAIDEQGRYAGKGDEAENTVIRRIIDSGVEMFPGRFSVQWNGMNDAALKGNTLYARNKGAIIGLQTNLRGGKSGEGAKCRVPGKDELQTCTAESYEAILKRAVEQGAGYVTVWQSDVLEFPQAVERTSELLKSRRSRSNAG